MNIGYISNFGNYPPQGGSSVHVYQLVHGFVKAGHHVHALQGDYPFDHYVRYAQNDLSAFCRAIDILYLRLGGGIRQDIYSLLKLRTRPRVPLIWEINAPAFERRNARTAVVDLTWRMLSGLVDTAICISAELRDYIQQRYRIKTVVSIPNGSDPELFSPHKAQRATVFPDFAPDDFLVLWAGSAQFPWQGVDLVYRAARQMLSVNGNIKFVLMTQAAHLRQAPLANMTVLPSVPYLAVADYVASADACLALYEDVPWSPIGYYFSPLKLYDYMSCAKPVIASNQGQIRQVIRTGENGLLTDNNVEDMVQKLLALYQDRDQAAQLGARARADVIQHHTWDGVVRQTLNLMEDGCHGPS